MKLPAPFIQLPVRFDAEALAREVAAIDEAGWRSHPGGIPGNSALPLITTEGDPASDQVTGHMRPTPWLEKLPYLMQVLESLGATWGRSRLMRLSGRSEVTGHVDINYYWREHMRVHVPIVTTPSVRFQCGGHEVNMAAGECWIFDTWRHHRVLNQGEETRIHLVADTVGGVGFWNLLEQGRTPERREPGWSPRRVEPGAGHAARLDYESFNAPEVMTPWELRDIVAFLIGETERAPQVAAIHALLTRFARHWHGLWARHGNQASGLPHYRALLDEVQQALAQAGVAQVRLQNGLGLLQVLKAHVFSMALAADVDEASRRDPHDARPPGTSAAKPAGAARIPAFERPVFIVSPPRSGSTLLFETLARAGDVFTIGDESHHLIEAVPGLAPAHRGFDSNRLVAQDATPARAQALRERFAEALRDRDGAPPDGRDTVRMLEKTPKNALRVPFLKSVFPEARFIYLHRDPRQVWGSMIDAWQSGRFRTYPQLPGWDGPAWSFLLTPGWQALKGQDLGEIVARQWETTVRVMLDDLEALPADDWSSLDYGRFLQDPQREALRLSEWAGWSWDRELEATLPLSRYTLSKPDPEKWRRHATEIEPRLLQWQATVERAARAAGR